MLARAGLFGDDGRRAAERLQALEAQRMQLSALQDDVLTALHSLNVPAGPGWRSPSALRYAQQRAQLAAEVQQVVRAVDDALAAVGRALAHPSWEP